MRRGDWEGGKRGGETQALRNVTPKSKPAGLKPGATNAAQSLPVLRIHS